MADPLDATLGPLVAGYVLVTIREAFAVAPSLVATRVAVVRASEPDAYGVQRLECLLAARFARQALTGIRCEEADSAKILADTASDLVLRQAGRSSELQPLNLSEHEELQQLLASIDADDLRLTPDLQVGVMSLQLSIHIYQN